MSWEVGNIPRRPPGPSLPARGPTYAPRTHLVPNQMCFGGAVARTTCLSPGLVAIPWPPGISRIFQEFPGRPVAGSWYPRILLWLAMAPPRAAQKSPENPKAAHGENHLPSPRFSDDSGPPRICPGRQEIFLGGPRGRPSPPGGPTYAPRTHLVPNQMSFGGAEARTTCLSPV